MNPKRSWKGKAIEHYEKFLDLWKDVDPGILEVDARKRLGVNDPRFYLSPANFSLLGMFLSIYYYQGSGSEGEN